MKAAGAGELNLESNVVELGSHRESSVDLDGALSEARHGFELQASALLQMAGRLGSEYQAALEILLECRGRVVVSGIGKSGHIGRKLAATFVCTGTPSVFLHPAEALHGDLGLVGAGDVVLFVSYSGETPEVTRLLPHFSSRGIPLIAIVGNRCSTLAQQVDVALDVAVEREICPHDLAPTCSALASLAMGDALAIAVMRAKGFSAKDFAQLHPGGRLGSQLRLVGEAMHQHDLPLVAPETTVGESLLTISRGRCGLAIVVGDAGRLLGLVTDGDLRRALVAESNLLEMPIQAIMTPNPVTIREDATVTEAEARMQRLRLKALIVLNPEDRVSGVIEVFK